MKSVSDRILADKGHFGILDSGRKEVEYEDFGGRKLDRKLLDLLQEFA